MLAAHRAAGVVTFARHVWNVASQKQSPLRTAQDGCVSESEHVGPQVPLMPRWHSVAATQATDEKDEQSRMVIGRGVGTGVGLGVGFGVRNDDEDELEELDELDENLGFGVGLGVCREVGCGVWAGAGVTGPGTGAGVGFGVAEGIGLHLPRCAFQRHIPALALQPSGVVVSRHDFTHAVLFTRTQAGSRRHCCVEA